MYLRNISWFGRT